MLLYVRVYIAVVDTPPGVYVMHRVLTRNARVYEGRSQSKWYWAVSQKAPRFLKKLFYRKVR